MLQPGTFAARYAAPKHGGRGTARPDGIRRAVGSARPLRLPSREPARAWRGKGATGPRALRRGAQLSEHRRRPRLLLLHHRPNLSWYRLRGERLMLVDRVLADLDLPQPSDQGGNPLRGSRL